MPMATKRTPSELAWIHFWRDHGKHFTAADAIPHSMVLKDQPKRSHGIALAFSCLGLVAALTISAGLGLLIAAAGFFLQEVKS